MFAAPFMRAVWGPIALALAVLCAPGLGDLSQAHATVATESRDTLYPYDGSDLTFDVLRKGRKVGNHRLSFLPGSEGLAVEAETSIKVSILGIPLYTYRYLSRETWVKGRLQSVDTKVWENGEATEVRANRVDDGFLVSNQSEALELTGDVYTTNHWNAGVLASDFVFNTATGKANAITVTSKGRETVASAVGLAEAEKFQFRGDLNIDVWYDRDGRWMKLAFADSRGAELVLECTSCGLPIRSAEEAG